MVVKCEVAEMKRVDLEIDPDVGLEPQDVEVVLDLLSDAGRFKDQVVQVNIFRPSTTHPALLKRLTSAINERLRQLGKEPAFNIY